MDNTNLYIGIMTGTSIDAVDTVLVNFEKKTFQLIATHSQPIPNQLRQKIIQLCYPGQDSIHLMGEVDQQLGHIYANNVEQLLKNSAEKKENIKAIGCHGQTIRHAPNHRHPYTIQIGNPNIITGETSITTITDFRRKDLALGGQAAPLTPLFHAYLTQDIQHDAAVVNIGGISNITIFTRHQKVIGFDSGPGNTLLDSWCEQHRNKRFDFNGQWAQSGKPDQTLLDHMLNDPYFKQSHPKSTGREYFNLTWLQQKIKETQTKALPQDIQSTLIELTANSILQPLQTHTHIKALWVCGGGAFNTFLMQRLRTLAPSLHIATTQELGIAPQWVEASCFAWLAKRTLEKLPGNLPNVTGANKSAILGAIYQA